MLITCLCRNNKIAGPSDPKRCPSDPRTKRTILSSPLGQPLPLFSLLVPVILPLQNRSLCRHTLNMPLTSPLLPVIWVARHPVVDRSLMAACDPARRPHEPATGPRMQAVLPHAVDPVFSERPVSYLGTDLQVGFPQVKEHYSMKSWKKRDWPVRAPRPKRWL
jgi:hypothetical protein